MFNLKNGIFTLIVVLSLGACGKQEEKNAPSPEAAPATGTAPQAEATPSPLPEVTASPVIDDAANLVGMWAFRKKAVFPEIIFYTNKQFQYISEGYEFPVNGVFQLEVYAGTYEADGKNIKLNFLKSSCKGEKGTQKIRYKLRYHSTGKDLEIGSGDIYWPIPFPKGKDVVYGCYSGEKFEKSEKLFDLE